MHVLLYLGEIPDLAAKDPQTAVLGLHMVEHPVVQTFGLVQHGVCAGVSIDSVGRLLLSFNEKRAIFLKSGGFLRLLDLSSVAPGAQSVTSATIHPDGGTVFVATSDKGIWKAPLDSEGTVGPGTLLVENTMLPDTWGYRTLYAAGTPVHALSVMHHGHAPIGPA